MAKKNKAIIRKIGKRGSIDVSALLRKGKIVDLRMGRWRAEQRLLPEDLCLDEVDHSVLDQYVTLGKKSLIPPKVQRRLNVIENSARYALKRHSLETPFGTFVTAAAYPSLCREMDIFERQWMSMREVLVVEFKDNEAEVREAYRSLAMALYKHLREEEESGIRKFRRDARQYASRVIEAIPSANKIRNLFHFHFQDFDIPKIQGLDHAVRRELLEEEGMKLKLATKAQKEEQIRKMQQISAARYYERKDKTIDQFLTSVNTQVRTMVHTVVEAALGSMERNDGLIGKTASQLQNLCERFNMLNILDDKEIETELKKLTKELSKKSTDRNERSIEKMLVDLKLIARETTLDLNMPVRRTRSEILEDEDGIEVPTRGREVRSREILEDVGAI